jgi:hypothetical protein
MIKRFNAPGPWITRDLRPCVLASDYDALADAAQELVRVLKMEENECRFDQRCPNREQHHAPPVQGADRRGEGINKRGKSKSDAAGESNG